MANSSISTKSTSYNLISYSRIYVTKTLTKKPINTEEDHFCVQQKGNKDGFKCKGEILDSNGKRIGNNNGGDDGVILHRVIESSHHWKLQFDRNTKGINVVVKFAKVGIETFLSKI